MTEEIVLSTEQSVLSIIERAASNPEVDVAKMSALLDMQLKIMDRQAEISFNRDFALACDRMPKIEKHGVIDMGAKGKMFYAKYEDVYSQIKPIEKEFGFTRSFTTAPYAEGVQVTLHLKHRDGHSQTSTLLMPPDTGAGRNAMQARGSASSYAKRYMTLDIWDIITGGQDDDANGAECISDAQCDEIEKLLDESGADVKRFLLHFKAEAVHKVQRRDFAEAVSMLKQKARQKK